MSDPLARFVRDESASVAVEYGLLMVLIGIAAVAALESVGLAISELFDAVRRKLDAAQPR
jgi:Flp pilus assembly pilin Flp